MGIIHEGCHTGLPPALTNDKFCCFTLHNLQMVDVVGLKEVPDPVCILQWWLYKCLIRKLYGVFSTHTNCSGDGLGSSGTLTTYGWCGVIHKDGVSDLLTAITESWCPMPGLMQMFLIISGEDMKIRSSICKSCVLVHLPFVWGTCHL